MNFIDRDTKEDKTQTATTNLSATQKFPSSCQDAEISESIAFGVLYSIMSAADANIFDGLPFQHGAAIEELGREYQTVVERLTNFDPVLTAAKFGALLAWPELQANCVRLEALVHLAMTYCGGQEAPDDQLVTASFDHLSHGYCGRMEDPSEDVFAALVNTSAGNFRIFEGISEGAGFFLQRFLNIVETMPRRGQFARLRNAVESLLKLSEAIATRAGVSENILGQETPSAAFPMERANRLETASDLVRFTDDELAEFGIIPDSLSEFAFSLEISPKLRTQVIGNTDLERRPIGVRDGCYFLLLPTAVSIAIRRLIIETVTSVGVTGLFELALAEEYGMLLYRSRFLGTRLPEPPPFEKMGGGRIASYVGEIDPGRFIHAIFFMDGLDGFLENGFNGMNADPDSLAETVRSLVTRVASDINERTGLIEGLLLVVFCGYGRTFALSLERDLIPISWQLEFIAIHDLNTLNWLDDFNALSILRLQGAQEALSRQHVLLFNVNGLINLVAWARKLNGHLVPHGQIPDNFGVGDSPDVVVVDQNALRHIRHEALIKWDPRRVVDASGRWVKVLKARASPFGDDRDLPLYASEEDVFQGKLRAVFTAPARPWWIEIVAPESATKDSIYQHWMMLVVWLGRSAPILDGVFQLLPGFPVSIRASFEEIVGPTTNRNNSAVGFSELRSLLTISADAATNRIDIDVGRGFHEGFFQPENVGERVLVEALVMGAAMLAGERNDSQKINELVQRICPNPRVRHIHRFEARSFRDYAKDIPKEPTIIDQLDDATFKIGLGWKVRSRDSGADIKGITECTLYLNDIVRVVLDELCGLLRQLDRRMALDSVIRNYEAAAHDRDVWKRTTQAMLALGDDSESAMRTIVEHQSRLNTCFTSSRILIEATICECPLNGGRTPGRLDLSMAMALAMNGVSLWRMVRCNLLGSH